MSAFSRTTRSKSVMLGNGQDPRAWDDEAVAEVVELWRLTPQDEIHLRTLQHLLSDLNHWKNDPFEVVRYYVEYRTVPRAAVMFRNMVEWRIAHKMDDFIADYGEPPKLFHYLPTFLCQGLDREDDPIYVERTGAADPYGLVLQYGIEGLADYTQFIRETTTCRFPRRHGRNRDRFCWQRDHYEPLVGRRMRQFTVLMDMEGLNARHMRGGLLGLLRRMARISQDMYAGMAKRVIILRAPAIFQWGWNHIVQHFFDEHIRNIIVFSGPDDYLQVLDKYIDLTVLPDCLAPGIGTGQAMPGYFQHIHLEGGAIPKPQDYIPAMIEELSMAPSLDDEVITMDGSARPKVGVRAGSLLVGVAAGPLFKGVWDNRPSSSSRTQVTVLSVLSESGRSCSSNDSEPTEDQ